MDGAVELQMRSLELHESAQENLLQAQNLINRVCLGDAGDHFDGQLLIRCPFIGVTVDGESPNIRPESTDDKDVKTYVCPQYVDIAYCEDKSKRKDNKTRTIAAGGCPYIDLSAAEARQSVKIAESGKTAARDARLETKKASLLLKKAQTLPVEERSRIVASVAKSKKRLEAAQFSAVSSQQAAQKLLKHVRSSSLWADKQEQKLVKYDKQDGFGGGLLRRTIQCEDCTVYRCD